MTELGSARGSVVVDMPGSDGGSIEVCWGAATDIGRKRKLNEDSYLAQSPMFVVADGMGGHAAGDIASAAVVTRLAELTDRDYVAPEAILECLRQATADITLADDDDEVGVGTTVTGAVLTSRGGAAYWAVFNIGDSRVYRFENNEFRQVTIDHSVVQELVDAGRISADEAEAHPDSNVITRAVGFGAEPVADFWLLPVRDGLRLLICSDGLSREVDERTLRRHLAAGLGAHETALELIDAALAGGGRDNITAVIVDTVSSPVDIALETTVPSAAAV